MLYFLGAAADGLGNVPFVVEAKQASCLDHPYINPYKGFVPASCPFHSSLEGSHYLQSWGMAAASSGRSEVDTSRAFRSVKEAVAVFGERIIARETQVRLGAHAGQSVVRERGSWPNASAVAALTLKLEGSGGVKPSGLVIRESPSKPNAIADAIAKHEASSSKPATNPIMVSASQPMCLVPSSSPFCGSSSSVTNDDGRQDCKEADLIVMSSIKKIEEEAAKTRQEAVQVKRRLVDLELAMANLHAKLHRVLSKLAHMEADKAAAARASIEQRSNNTAALTIWMEPKPEQQPRRHQLGHLLSLDDDAGEAEVIHVQGKEARKKSKVQKQKPIVPLVVPLIHDMLFSKKKKKKSMQDNESLYMKELYSLLSLT
ncbi:uncharacterized protein LOC100841266 [Brachypodium distachyon]|nr:uncharacterized protein LOC100841266 [Brachypodium distachyon]|eukprot:XP_024311117.1 uncharacterized protein LOC100841266 [Brachypodium distachyon]